MTCILMLCVVVILSLDAEDNFSTLSVTVSDSPCQDTTHPDNQLTSSYVIPGFKQFSIRLVCSLGDQCKVMLLCSPKLQTCSFLCGKNISDTLGCASCATFLFLPHFDVICDLLLNRRTATWNLLILLSRTHTRQTNSGNVVSSL